jgi:ribosomal protein S18 acetylase RimI-like enzyme
VSTGKNRQNQTPAEYIKEQVEKITIRKARSIDRAFVISLGKQLFETYGPYERAIALWFDQETTATFIAQYDRIRAGFIMIGTLDHRRQRPSSFELLAIGCRRSTRRKGLGTRMMETVEEYAAHRELNRIFLHTAVTNYPAQRLFYKRGYRPLGLKTRFYPAGQDAIVMSKKIQHGICKGDDC